MSIETISGGGRNMQDGNLVGVSHHHGTASSTRIFKEFRAFQDKMHL